MSTRCKVVKNIPRPPHPHPPSRHFPSHLTRRRRGAPRQVCPALTRPAWAQTHSRTGEDMDGGARTWAHAAVRTALPLRSAHTRGIPDAFNRRRRPLFSLALARQHTWDLTGEEDMFDQYRKRMVAQRESDREWRGGEREWRGGERE